jgi:hypothetical protein
MYTVHWERGRKRREQQNEEEVVSTVTRLRRDEQNGKGRNDGKAGPSVRRRNIREKEKTGDKGSKMREKEGTGEIRMEQEGEGRNRRKKDGTVGGWKEQQ